jgi:hypothetical protein
MRRHSAGDVAVEISIALDALLGDPEGELTWKVGLRAALLAGGKKPDRKVRRSIVSAIYALRSTVVHTGRVPPEQKTKGLGKLKVDDLSQRGLVVAAEIIRAAIMRGALPDWFDEELGPDEIVDPAETVASLVELSTPHASPEGE